MFTNSLNIGANTYYYFDLKKVFEHYPKLKKLPNSLKILLESNLRNTKQEEHKNIIEIFLSRNNLKYIEFYPNRIVLEDADGISALLELVSYSEENDLNLSPKIMLDVVLNPKANETKAKEEFSFIKWASKRFGNFSVIPPNNDNNKQVNIEYLSTLISSKTVENKIFLFPEAIVGTNSFATKINALGVLGLKINSINAKASILGAASSFSFPKVIGIDVVGSLAQGVSILDTTLTLINIIEKLDIKGTIVEFYGDGLKNISIDDRAILAHKVVECKALSAYFSIDDTSLSYVEKTRGIDASFFKHYYEKQDLYTASSYIEYDEVVKFDLSAIKAVILGPKTIQDRNSIHDLKLNNYKKGNFIKDNDIVLSYINTNCSNLSLLVQAGLLAKNAVNLGLQINKNIKRVFILGSNSIVRYLDELDLLESFAKLGFYFTTDKKEDNLIERVVLDIEKFNLNTSSLSFNTDDTIESNPLIKSNWFMSPALVIAYSLKGTINCDISKESIFNDIYLKDIWPSISEVNEYLEKIPSESYKNTYKDIFEGNKQWKELSSIEEFNFEDDFTYIQKVQVPKNTKEKNIEIIDAKILAIFENDIPMQVITPSGKIPPYSPSSFYLEAKGLKPDKFFSFEERSNNSELMKRGTLSNISLKNRIVSPKEGGYTKDFNTYEVIPIYELSNRLDEKTPLVIIAKKNFACGEFFEWSIKGLQHLGVKVVLANSFYEEYRLGLISLGILPLEFIDDDIDSLHLKGNETISIINETILADTKINIQIKRENEIKNLEVKSRLDTNLEVLYYKNGGILNYLISKH